MIVFTREFRKKLHRLRNPSSRCRWDMRLETLLLLLFPFVHWHCSTFFVVSSIQLSPIFCAMTLIPSSHISQYKNKRERIKLATLPCLRRSGSIQVTNRNYTNILPGCRLLTQQIEYLKTTTANKMEWNNSRETRSRIKTILTDIQVSIQER